MGTVHDGSAFIVYMITLALGVIVLVLGSVYFYVWVRYYRREPGYLWKRRGNVVIVPEVRSRTPSAFLEETDEDASSGGGGVQSNS